MNVWVLINIIILSVGCGFLLKTLWNHFKVEKRRDSRLIQMDYLTKKYGLPHRCLIYHDHFVTHESFYSMWLFHKRNSSNKIPIKTFAHLKNGPLVAWKGQLYRLLSSLPMHAISDLCVIYTDKKFIKAIKEMKPGENELDKMIVRELMALELNEIHVRFEPKDSKLEGCMEAKKELKK